MTGTDLVGFDSKSDQARSLALPNIPLAAPDQTLDSLVALAGIENGFQVGREATGRVLGRPNIKTDRAFHTGLLHAREVLGQADIHSFEQFVANHGFLPFFKPFLPNKTYARVMAKLESNNVAGLSHVMAGCDFTVTRDCYRYCLQCAASSMDKRGYAYAHRCDQVLCVDFCGEHGAILFTRVGGDPVPEAVRHGLILPSDYDDWRQSLMPISPLSESRTWHALGRWVNAVLSGEFPFISAEIRVELLRRRIAELPREQGDPCSPAGRLERHLIRTYGSAAFDKLGLPIYSGVTGHWPAFLVLGTAYADHPLANLLAISALFDSPADLVERAAQLLPLTEAFAKAKPKSTVRPRRFAWNLSVVRDFYREDCLLEIARKRNNDIETIESMLRLHPELPKRREKFLAWRERKRMRRVMERFLRAHPGATRTAAADHDRSAFDWLMRHDREWIEQRLPWSRSSRPWQIANVDVKLLDAGLVRRIKGIAEYQIAEFGTERITRRLLVSHLAPEERKMLNAGMLPRAGNQIDALTESKKAYMDRIEHNLKTLIADKDIPRARHAATLAIRALWDRPDCLARIIDAVIRYDLPVENLKTAA